MRARHRAPLLLLAIAALPAIRATAQDREPEPPRELERAPHIDFDATVFSGRNPFLIVGERAMTTGGEVSAKGDGRVAIGSRTALDAGGQLAFRHYNRRYGSFVTGNARAMIDHRASDKLSTQTEASYERFLPLDGLAASIDAAIDPVNLQERYMAAQSVRWRPDEYLTLSGQVSWNRLAPRGSLLLTRTDATNFALSAERRLTRYTWIGAEGRHTIGTTSDGARAEASAFVLKAGTRLAENLSAEAEAGLARIERREVDGRREGGSAQATTAASLCYDPTGIRICLSGRIAPVVTAFGGIRREKTLSASANIQTSGNGTLIANGEYRSAPGSNFLADAEVLRLRTAYEHRIDRRFLVHVGADYDRRTGITSQTIDTWTIRAGVTFRIPRR